METKWAISESGGDVLPGCPGLNDTRVGTPILPLQPSMANNVWATVQGSFLMYKLSLTVYFNAVLLKTKQRRNHILCLGEKIGFWALRDRSGHLSCRLSLIMIHFLSGYEF